MSNSPSRYRREGREAFYPGGNYAESCPYKQDHDTWRRQNWVEGWLVAERSYIPPEDRVCECDGPEDCCACPSGGRKGCKLESLERVIEAYLIKRGIVALNK